MKVRKLLFILIISFIFPLSLWTQSEIDLKANENTVLEKEKFFSGTSIMEKKITFKEVFSSIVNLYNEKLSQQLGEEKKELIQKIVFAQKYLIALYNLEKEFYHPLEKRIISLLLSEYKLNIAEVFLKEALKNIATGENLKLDKLFLLKFISLQNFYQKLSDIYKKRWESFPLFYLNYPQYQDLRTTSLDTLLEDASEEISDSVKLKLQLFKKDNIEKAALIFWKKLTNNNFSQDKALIEKLSQYKEQLSKYWGTFNDLENKLSAYLENISSFGDELAFLSKEDRIKKWEVFSKKYFLLRQKFISYRIALSLIAPEVIIEKMEALEKIVPEISSFPSVPEKNSPELEKLSQEIESTFSNKDKIATSNVQKIKTEILNIVGKTLQQEESYLKSSAKSNLEFLKDIGSKSKIYLAFKEWTTLFLSQLNRGLLFELDFFPNLALSLGKKMAESWKKFANFFPLFSNSKNTSLTNNANGVNVLDTLANLVKSDNNIKQSNSSQIEKKDRTTNNTSSNTNSNTTINNNNNNANATINNPENKLVALQAKKDNVAVSTSTDEKKERNDQPTPNTEEKEEKGLLDVISSWVSSAPSSDSQNNQVKKQDKENGPQTPVTTQNNSKTITVSDKKETSLSQENQDKEKQILSNNNNNNNNNLSEQKEEKTDITINPSKENKEEVITAREKDKTFTRYISKSGTFYFDYDKNEWKIVKPAYDYEFSLKRKNAFFPTISLAFYLSKAKNLDEFLKERFTLLEKRYGGMDYNFLKSENIANQYYVIYYSFSFMGIRCQAIEYLKGENHNFWVLNLIGEDSKDYQNLVKEMFLKLKVIKTMPYKKRKKIVKTKKIAKHKKKVIKTSSKPKTFSRKITTVHKKSSPQERKSSLKEKLAKLKQKVKSSLSRPAHPTANISSLSGKIKLYYSLLKKFEKEVSRWENTTFRQKRIIRVSHRVKYKVKDLYRRIQQTEGNIKKDIKKYGKIGSLIDVQKKFILLHYRAAQLVGWIR